MLGRDGLRYGYADAVALPCIEGLKETPDANVAVEESATLQLIPPLVPSLLF